MASHDEEITPNELQQLHLSDPTPVKQEKDKKKMKKKKASKKGAMNPALLTPEYLAEQRALKQAAKEAKAKELIAQGIDPDQADISPDLRYIRREFLSVPHLTDKNNSNDRTFNITVMTYNVLAQALIRRKLFPTSGNALKWSKRSVVLLNEIKHYEADILCLQEVDKVQYDSYWKLQLHKLGYDHKYYRADIKTHGICVFWKRDKFKCIDVCHVQLDNEPTGDIPKPAITANVGLILALQFSDSVLAQFPDTAMKGCIVGTTHMFWHPFGTFARTLQSYIMLNKIKELTHRVDVLHNTNSAQWFKFLAGDFNSQPDEASYLSITRKPVFYDGKTKRVFANSSTYPFPQNDIEEGGGDEEGEEQEEKIDGENCTNKASLTRRQPLDDPIPPEDYEVDQTQQVLMDKVITLHNSSRMRAISLYSVAYHLVHSENTDNDRHEPIFSNWAHVFRGLLDYIFVVSTWDPAVARQEVDPLHVFEKENGITIHALLRMPLPEEMGPEPSGQPREGMYGSDHLCVAAKIGLSM